MANLLIDADYFLYKNAAACETEIDWGDDVIVVSSRFSSLQRNLKREIDRISERFDYDNLILFFSGPDNFRKVIDPEYKGQRNRKKPCGYVRAINWLKTEYEVIITPTLEADDALGIYQTSSDEQHLIVSPDKDMRQIPGFLWDGTAEHVSYIEEHEGDRWHLIQTLAGDATDGYSGCPSYGVKKATTTLEKHGYTWQTVLDCYLKQDLTETDALRNARLARILRACDYDVDLQQPILWTPASGN
jgi:5'-3' exonuclease